MKLPPARDASPARRPRGRPRAFDRDQAPARAMQAFWSKGYAAALGAPDLVVSVCDRAREEAWPFGGRGLHWSIPDPVAAGTTSAFRRAFSEISARVTELAGASPRLTAPVVTRNAREAIS